MKIKSTLLILFAMILLAATTFAYSGTVRGRLERQGPYGIYPVPYVPLTLYSSAMGRSSPAYTGPDGMYYFYNVQSGKYNLEIWIQDFGYPPIIYFITVFDQPYTDIKPILIP